MLDGKSRTHLLTRAGVIVAVFLMIFIPPASAQVSEPPEYFHAKEITLTLQGYNATVDIHFSLDPLAKAYVLLFGARAIEPKVKDFLPFKTVDIVALDSSHATVLVTNITNLSDERGNITYFLYKEYTFPQVLKKITIIYPDGSQIELAERDSTPPKIASIYH